MIFLNICYYVSINFAFIVLKQWNQYLSFVDVFPDIVFIMAKTRSSSGKLKETVRWGYDPATHLTNIAKTLKCKVIWHDDMMTCRLLTVWYIVLQAKKKKSGYDKERYQSKKAKEGKTKSRRCKGGKGKARKKWFCTYFIEKKICNKCISPICISKLLIFHPQFDSYWMVGDTFWPLVTQECIPLGK